jgi:predicted DNA-binding protein (UPF0251 family)
MKKRAVSPEPVEPFDDDPTPPGWRLVGSPENAPETAATRHAIAPHKVEMTDGQRKRLARNLAIYDAHTRLGVSHRTLAKTWGIARSRIAAIIDEFKARGKAC